VPDVEDYFSAFDAPVVVVTTSGAKNVRSGCLVGFATQCSIHPPRFLVCLSVLNHTARIAEDAATLGVQVLGSEQSPVASLFGEETGEEVDKLARVPWRHGQLETPILVDCAAWMEGKILQRIPLGDHIGYLLEPVGGGLGPRSGVLLRSSVATLQPGHPADEVSEP
jgi:flavin reductase (DIM6/NTAB) family NADH-FMN oxidoreductase RutF